MKDALPMAFRLKIADDAAMLIDAGFTATADALLDAVRCCDHFPECSHVLGFHAEPPRVPE